MSNKEEYINKNRVFIPVKLLIRMHSQLKINSNAKIYNKSLEGISKYLEDYFYIDFKGKHVDLFHQFNARGLSFNDGTLERVLKGKKGSLEVNKGYEVSFELLDLFSYASWDESLIHVIFDKNNDWEKNTLYSVLLPEYALMELNKQLPLNKSKFMNDISISNGNYINAIQDDRILIEVSTREIIVKISGDFDNFKENEYLNKFKSALDIVGEIIIKKKKRGSIILTLELNTIECEKILLAFKYGFLKEFNVIEVLLPETHEDSDIQYYASELKTNTNSEIAHYNYALLLYKHSDFITAEKHLEIALKINSQYKSAHLLYAILLELKNDLIGAKKHYEIISILNYEESTSFSDRVKNDSFDPESQLTSSLQRLENEIKDKKIPIPKKLSNKNLNQIINEGIELKSLKRPKK